MMKRCVSCKAVRVCSVSCLILLGAEAGGREPVAAENRALRATSRPHGKVLISHGSHRARPHKVLSHLLPRPCLRQRRPAELQLAREWPQPQPRAVDRIGGRDEGQLAHAGLRCGGAGAGGERGPEGHVLGPEEGRGDVVIEEPGQCLGPGKTRGLTLEFGGMGLFVEGFHEKKVSF